MIGEAIQLIDPTFLQDIAAGATILGSGGGGDPAVPLMMAQRAIERFGPVELIRLESVPDEAWLIPPAIVGAPTVTLEKLPAGTEAARAFRMLEQYLGVKAFAAYPSEIGGGNSLIPIVAAAELRLPIVDADMMGRAFPEVQMTTAAMHGVSAWPMSMADEKGNGVIIEAADNRMAERIARSVSVSMGGSSHICNYSMQGSAAKQALIQGSVSYAASIGRTLRLSREQKRDAVEGLCDLLQGILIAHGKIRDVQRRTERGFALGEVFISGMGEFSEERFRVAFQNENLVCWSGDRPVATTPDLISIVDEATGAAIPTECLRYGQRVAILGIPCNSKWRTPQGIALAGPRYFGYDIEYQPVENKHVA
jgi:hypothetical protein